MRQTTRNKGIRRGKQSSSSSRRSISSSNSASVLSTSIRAPPTSLSSRSDIPTTKGYSRSITTHTSPSRRAQLNVQQRRNLSTTSHSISPRLSIGGDIPTALSVTSRKPPSHQSLQLTSQGAAPAAVTRQAPSRSFAAPSYKPQQARRFRSPSLSLFQDYPDGYFKSDTIYPIGKYKGMRVGDLPDHYIQWLSGSGLTMLRDDLQRIATERGASKYYKSFNYASAELNQHDQNIFSKYDKLAESTKVPPHWGTGKAVPLMNVHQSIAKFQYIDAIIDKIVAIRGLAYRATTLDEILALDQAYPDIESICQATVIGTRKFPITQLQDTFSSPGLEDSAGDAKIFAPTPPPSVNDANMNTERTRIFTRFRHQLNAFTVKLYENNTIGVLTPPQQSSTLLNQALVRAKHTQHANDTNTRANNPVLNIARPLLINLQKNNLSSIPFDLDQSTRALLEPYLDVPTDLPSNLVFLDMESVTTGDMVDSFTHHLVQISAVDGKGREFNVNIRPPLEFTQINHDVTTYASGNYYRFWDYTSADTEAGVASFLEWFYHPSMGRFPVQQEINPDYVNPLEKMKIVTTIREEVGHRDITDDELRRLPPAVRKLFLDPQQRNNRLSYNFTTNVLTVNGIKAQVENQDGIDYNRVKSSIGADTTKIEVNDPSKVEDANIIDDSSGTKAKHQHRESTIAPPIVIGYNLPLSLRKFDKTLRDLDYLHHGNELGGISLEQLEALDPSARGEILQQHHRDLRMDSIRNTFFQNGILFIDASNFLQPFYMSPSPEVGGWRLRNVHAALCGFDTPLRAYDSLISAHMTRDLFMNSGLPGAFFRLELQRLIDLSFDKYFSQPKFPDVNVHSQKKFDFMTNSYIHDDTPGFIYNNTIPLSTSTNVQSVQSKMSGEYNHIATKGLLGTISDRYSSNQRTVSNQTPRHVDTATALPGLPGFIPLQPPKASNDEVPIPDL